MSLQSPSGGPASRDRPRCLNCHREIAIHQPDLDLPDRLLGTCPACKAWFLMDSFRHVVYPIPGDEEIFTIPGVTG